MKNGGKAIKATDFDKFTAEELADAFIFPAEEILTVKEKAEESLYWSQRRRELNDRPLAQKIYSRLMQLKYQLEDKIGSAQ